MNYTIEGLLLNLFFIMFPLIFYPFLVSEKLEDRPLIKNMVYYILFCGSSILCMIFPAAKQDGGFLFDFRMIPFLLACLYANRSVSLLMSITLITFRFMVGGHGAYINVISITLALTVAWLVRNKYQSLPLINKIITVSLISFISKVLGITSNMMFDPNYSLIYATLFYFIQALIMALVIYVIESIVRNVELRKELIASEKMKVVSVISASVAHEIRNPLTAVRGFIQLLSQPSIHQDKRLQYSAICLEELDRAQQIINDYLSLAKPQSETTEKLDLAVEISYVGNVLNSYANLNGVEVWIEYDENLYVFGERSKFRQSIINLAKNGIEAMGSQGGILKMIAKKHKNFVILFIIDNGNGMTQEQVERLGTPYFSSKDKGTGLGTMVSYQIIKNMMGKINITSEPGKGTEYRIVFPHV